MSEGDNLSAANNVEVAVRVPLDAAEIIDEAPEAPSPAKRVRVARKI